MNACQHLLDALSALVGQALAQDESGGSFWNQTDNSSRWCLNCSLSGMARSVAVRG